MKITFPIKTAKEIVDECDNKLGNGKLLYNISWYKDQDFYTKEKSRPRTMEVSDEIEHFGKTWDECNSLKKEGDEMMNMAEYLYFIQEYYKRNKDYPDYKWSWTSSRSSFGRIVCLGFCGADGVGVDDYYPGYSYSNLGVRFFRSVGTDSLGSKPGQGETFESRLKVLEDWKDHVIKSMNQK